MSTRAKFEWNSAPLKFEFGENFARRKFDDELIDSLPKYVKGKNKGKIKARISWFKCVSGGHFRRNGIAGITKKRNTVLYAVIETGDDWAGWKCLAYWSMPKVDCNVCYNHSGKDIASLESRTGKDIRGDERNYYNKIVVK